MRILCKRSISVILSVIMIIGIMFNNGMTFESKAAGVDISGSCGTNVTYSLSDEGVLTISGTGAMTNYTNVTIPPWYSNRNSINTVVIENGVTSIGDYAFISCGNLTDITIPDSVTSIGDYAFWFCVDLTDITIPDSVTSIGNAAFANCWNIKSITIPEGVNSIGFSAFYYCKKLNTITISSSVTEIMNGAFDGCSDLATIKFLGNCPTIGTSAFANISSNPEIIVPSDRASEYRAYFEANIPSASISLGAPVDPVIYSESSCSKSTSSPAHTHTLEWKTTTEPTINNDGEASLVCKTCGHVESTQTISRSGVVYMSYANKFEKMLTASKEGDTIKIDLGDWHSVPKYLMERIIAAPNDVELTYKYKGETFDIVIPKGKGIDLKINWYGPLLMKSLYGTK